jgi:cell division topological specificity factor
MGSFFDRMLGRGNNNKGSGTTAKERLQLVLVHDRINLPPERLQAMKREILEVISKYVEIDESQVDITLQPSDGRSSILVAEIPFLRAQEEAVDEFGDEAALPQTETDSNVLSAPEREADTQTATDTDQSVSSSAAQRLLLTVDDADEASAAETVANKPIDE